MQGVGRKVAKSLDVFTFAIVEAAISISNLSFYLPMFPNYVFKVLILWNVK